MVWSVGDDFYLTSDFDFFLTINVDACAGIDGHVHARNELSTS